MLMTARAEGDVTWGRRPGRRHERIPEHWQQEPVDRLTRLLDAALPKTNSTTDRPALSEALVRHPSAYVAAWQDAACAVVMAEREPPVNGVPLTGAQSAVVLADAAKLVRAVTILDQRLRRLPGWVSLRNPGRLLQAAESVTLALAGADTDHPVDYGVDVLGWRDRALGVIDGPALPGLAGVAQAQHNTYIALGTLPTALNLRRVLATQLATSAHLRRVTDPVDARLGEQFADRYQTYDTLSQAARQVGGRLGDGARAALESQHAADRAAALHLVDANDQTLSALRRLCSGIDLRIAQTIEHAFDEKLYFTSVQMPRLSEHVHAGIHRPRRYWTPVESVVQSDLLQVATQRLAVPPEPTPAPGVRDQAGPSRAQLDQLIERARGRTASRWVDHRNL